MTAKNEITKNASFYFFKHLTFAETALISAFMQRSRFVEKSDCKGVVHDFRYWRCWFYWR